MSVASRRVADEERSAGPCLGPCIIIEEDRLPGQERATRRIGCGVESMVHLVIAKGSHSLRGSNAPLPGDPDNRYLPAVKRRTAPRYSSLSRLRLDFEPPKANANYSSRIIPGDTRCHAVASSPPRRLTERDASVTHHAHFFLRTPHSICKL